MKKYMIKLAALLLFTSVAVSSCSLEYRQRHMRGRDDNGRGHDNNDGRGRNDGRGGNDRDNHYNNGQRY